MARRRSAPVAIAIALLAAGCGGDSGDGAAGADGGGGSGSTATETAPGFSMSRSEFIAAASKACRKARSNYEGDVAEFLNREEGRKPHPVLIADLAHQVLLQAIEAEMEAIRYLGVPDSEEDPIEELLDEAEFTLNEIVFQKRLRSMAVVYRQFGKASRMARAYGLPACIAEADAIVEAGGGRS